MSATNKELKLIIRNRPQRIDEEETKHSITKMTTNNIN